MSYNFLTIETPLSLKDAEESLSSSPGTYPVSDKVKVVSEILDEIKRNREKAILKFCRKYDGLDIKKFEDLKVSQEELDEAFSKVPERTPELVEAINAAHENIRKYHEEQLKYESKSWFLKQPAANRGTEGKGSPEELITPEESINFNDFEKITGQKITPLARVGLYIPGGRFLYPSSVLMAAVPAKVANVGQIIACSPPQKDGRISDVLLYVFSLLGINEVYKVGGAQAIGLMAYGTGDVKKVDKIVGPGNIYVTLAKKLVFGQVGIDSLAGPSEILVIADSSADSTFIAADLLSQAEHDPDARCILLVNDINTAQKVIEDIYMQVDGLKIEYKDRVNVLTLVETLKNNCKIFYNPDMNFLTDICNLVAPEHLEIMTGNFEEVLDKIKNAGAIFLGNYTPVATGDYICGTNHIIPTSGNARFSSSLGVYDFIKRSSVAYYSKNSLKRDAGYIKQLSDYENLLAHKNSVVVRVKNL